MREFYDAVNGVELTGDLNMCRWRRHESNVGRTCKHNKIGTSSERVRLELGQMDAGRKLVHIRNSQETICLQFDYTLSLAHAKDGQMGAIPALKE